MAQDSMPVQAATNIFGSGGKLDALQSEFNLNDKEMSAIQKVADLSSNPGQFLNQLESLLKGSNASGGEGPGESGGGEGGGGSDIMGLLMKLIQGILQQMGDKIKDLQKIFGGDTNQQTPGADSKV